ncbi:hypothetical protein HMPREF5505_1956, partial [Lactobacillus delbrueckii subsp. lactis DSM 20072]
GANASGSFLFASKKAKKQKRKSYTWARDAKKIKVFCYLKALMNTSLIRIL